jgi:tetratricopeptide (TPR) repeat protein
VLLVGVLTVLVHLGGVLGAADEYVYDDHRFVQANPAVNEIEAPWRYLDPETAGPGWEGIYRPIRTLSYALDVAVLGLSPRLMRLESVLLHALAAMLLATLLGRVLGSSAAAAAGALVFGLHPLTAEVSSWISSRGDVLALVIALLAALAHLKGRQVAAALLLFAALLSKESVIVFPVLLLLLDEARGARPLREEASRIAYGALGLSVLAYVGLRFVALRDAFGQSAPAGWPARRAAGILRDARVTLFPTGLGFDLQLEGSSIALFGAAALVVGLTVVAVVLWRRDRRLEATGIGWWLLALVPVSLPFLPLKIATADRFLYVALVGVALLVAATAARYRWPPAVKVVGAAALLVLAVLTVLRTPVYASDAALWGEALAADPENVRAQQGLAYDAYVEGRLREAMDRYEAYVEVVPEDAKARLILAQTYRRLGVAHEDVRSLLWARSLAEYREAIERWEQGETIGRETYLGTACLEAATLSILVGDPVLAEGYARSAIRAGERDEGLTLLLGAACMCVELGRQKDAVRAARSYMRLAEVAAGDVLRRMNDWWGEKAPLHRVMMARIAEELR